MTIIRMVDRRKLAKMTVQERRKYLERLGARPRDPQELPEKTRQVLDRAIRARSAERS